MASIFSHASHRFLERTERIKKETTRGDCRWTAPMRADGSLKQQYGKRGASQPNDRRAGSATGLTGPEVFQLAVEGLAHRHRWAAAIRG